ncbi:membrane bound O-acyl transferase family-domain-containing protein [Schizophyllum amplum]|uniref:Membrane bound O-acyl transferase family-domain-containing protein n=1 Tax=Schizophyllum amplum TaxID=97359 RepID=A0A550CXJ1_9AGAR|nr:membrane bound O-acyl transferase family-domain-containing protein [Auriculariopsis ampla]
MTDRIHDPSSFFASALCMLVPIPFVVATRPPLAVRILVFAAQLYISIRAVTTLTLGNPAIDYQGASIGFGWSAFTALHFYFLVDPLHDGTRHREDMQLAKDKPFGKRLWWATCLLFSNRGIGWTTAIPHLPQMPHYRSGKEFALARLRDAVFFFFVTDLAGTYFAQNPITSYRAGERLPISSQGLLFQCITVAITVCHFWANSQMSYSIISVIAVACGSEPRDWPPMWGDLLETYTLRKVWGRVWHQLMRRYVASTGKAVVHLLGVQRGTNASSYIQLYVGFLASGLTHTWGDRQIDVTVGDSVPFFMLQAIAITFEDGVIALAKKAGMKENAATWAVGRLWAATVLLATLPMLVRPALATGQPVDSGLPFSAVAALWSAAGLEGKIDFQWPEPSVL